MWNKIKIAWDGWIRMSQAGKLAGLMLAVVVVLVLCSIVLNKRKSWAGVVADVSEWITPESRQEGRGLFVYSTIMLVLCICPITAAILMLYQTKFYDYEWIFSYVPVTLMTALGISALINKIWSGHKEPKGILRAGAATLGILLLIFLCGAGKGQGQDETPLTNYKKTTLLLKEIKEKVAGDIYLWAPQDIMSAVRQTAPEIKLVYGRNVWDKSLDAYSYDTMEPEIPGMYYWMSQDKETGSYYFEGDLYIRKAVSEGVNVIVLTEEAWDQAISDVARITGDTPIRIDGYYVFILGK